MRPISIVGILLMLLGIFVLARGGGFTTQKDVVKVGDVKLTAPEEHSVPPWTGAVALVAGVAMAMAGFRGRNA
jgi:drug/metabolite transporter (DMT)-like permease